MLKMHGKYGEVIRLGPNELSFATEEGWRDIYMHRPGHKETKKDPIWYMGEQVFYQYHFHSFDISLYLAPNDMPQNIVTTTDINVRARMRRSLSEFQSGFEI